MKLPPEFVAKMQALMNDDEFRQFMDSFMMPRNYGLRINTLKISVGDFQKISPFHLEPIPWTKDGFYYIEGENPSKHPYYYAGLYYIQEPSAMFPGAVLDARPGDRVLDLCAAPGGKSVQIAAAMQGQGILVANDISQDRIKPLIKNIEQCGVRNAIILNESSKRLADVFAGFFDKILADAPCSGEGMFRKDDDAVRSYGKYKSGRCIDIQRDILRHADIMLKPGGCMVYSTCTFSPEENEDIIAEFLKDFPYYELMEIPKNGGIENGRPEWVHTGTEPNYSIHLERTARLWPHRIKGEGHFTAKLLKSAESITVSGRVKANGGACDMRSITNIKNKRSNLNLKNKATQTDKPPLQHFFNFMIENTNLHLNAGILKKPFSSSNSSSRGSINNSGSSGTSNSSSSNSSISNSCSSNSSSSISSSNNYNSGLIEDGSFFFNGYVFLIGNNLYYLPEPLPVLDGIKTAKFGWFLGTLSEEKFEPSHSMVVSMKMENFKNTLNFCPASKEMNSYLKGETLMIEGRKALTAVCVDGFTAGWARQSGDMLKNLYPKGWRLMK